MRAEISFVVVLVATTLYATLDGLNCDGVETNMSGIITAVPAGVCINDQQFMLECKGSTMYYNSYNSDDCSGSATTFEASMVYSTDFYGEVHMVCSGTPCNYIKIYQYNVSDCQQNADNVPFVDPAIYIENYCTEVSTISSSVNCDSTTAMMAYMTSYFNGDCSGNGTVLNYPMGNKKCISDELYNVECGAAGKAPTTTTSTPATTSLATTNTSAPTTTTSAPTTSTSSTSVPPTTAPTNDDSKNNDDGPGSSILVPVIIVVAVIACIFVVIGLVGWRMMQKKKKQGNMLYQNLTDDKL